MINIKLLYLFAIAFFFISCSSRHISIDKDREVSFSKQNSSLLYEYAKEDIASFSPNSGYYPLANHLDSLSARLILARVATKSIKLQYFTFHADPAGKLLMKVLLDAADRGVKVEMLIDDIDLGTQDYVTAVINNHKNITVRTFNPTNERESLRYLEIGIYSGSLGRRMHNKAFIVDNSMAIFGGRNIGDIYFGLNRDNYFIDNDILVAGPFVNEITNAFETYFASKYSVDFEKIQEASFEDLVEGRKEYDKALQTKEVKHFKEVVLNRPFVKAFLDKQLPLYFGEAKLYFDGPDKIGTADDNKTYHIEGTFDDKYIPKKSLVIVNPYFIPNDEMMKKFKKLRERGISISILTNSLESTDGKSVYAYYSLKQKELLEMGVKLFEIHPSAFREDLKNQAYNTKKRVPRATLHAKTMIIDAKYFVIGSRNLDPRSRNLNTEMVAIIKNEALAKHEQKIFELMSHAENAYRLSLKCESKDECEIRWNAILQGKEHVFDSDGDAGIWDKITVFFARVFPIRDLL